MLVHCNSKFRPYIIQFLVPNSDYFDRKLEIGICPHCLNQIAKLTQTRKLDNQTFDSYFAKRKAEAIIKELSNQIEYTSNDIIPKKGLFGFRYGETKEKRNSDGTISITHKACDFYGNKEIVEKKIFKPI